MSYRFNMLNLIPYFQTLSQNNDYLVLPGLHALKHALRFKAEINLSLTPNKTDLLKLAKQIAPDTLEFIEAKVEEVEPGQYKSLLKDAHRTGVISIARKPSLKLSNILSSQKPIVLIEDCRNLKNLGAVIRVSAGADIGAVLSLSKQVDIWHPDVLIGSAGLNFALPCMNITEDDLSLIKQTRTLVALDPEGEELKLNYGHPVRRLADDSGSPRKSLKTRSPIYIFGTERDGISPQLLNLSDSKIRIPMREGVSSLNLATSVAVVVYALTSFNL